MIAAVNCTVEAFSPDIQWLILRWLNSACSLAAYVSGELISLSSHKSDTFPPYQTLASSESTGPSALKLYLVGYQRGLVLICIFLIPRNSLY